MRNFTASVKDDKYDTEEDSHYSYDVLEYELDHMALMLVDVWESHPNNGWTERARRHIKSKIVPLLKLARKHNLKVIHAHHTY